MNIDKHLLGVLVDAVREGIPGATVSDVPAIIVYAHKGEAFTTVELDIKQMEFLFRNYGIEAVREHMRDRAEIHAKSLDHMIAEGRR